MYLYFYALLNNTILVQEDMSHLYLELEPTPKKVLKSLRFPESMTPEELPLEVTLEETCVGNERPRKFGIISKIQYWFRSDL